VEFGSIAVPDNFAALHSYQIGKSRTYSGRPRACRTVIMGLGASWVPILRFRAMPLRAKGLKTFAGDVAERLKAAVC
jgi:hypothetical protein